MLASPKRLTAAVQDVPADLQAAEALADWRNHVRWPIGIDEANRICAAQMREALKWAGSLDAGLPRDSALLALPDILGYGRAIVLLALAVSRAQEWGIRLVGSDPELSYLQSGQGPLPDRSAPILPPEKVRFQLARRFMRIRSWSSPLRTVNAFINPTAVAISHNSLLRKAAAGAQGAVGFRHAGLILDAALRQSNDTAAMRHDASRLAHAILADTIRDDACRSRAADLLQAVAGSHFAKAVRTMQALRVAHLPETVWAGSGGLYPLRAVGLEILRRGGKVIRFDHGKPKGFVEAREIDALVEFAVSSEFVTATEDAAALTRDYSDESLISWMKHPRIGGTDGDPTFARLPAMRERRARADRLRVVYAPTQLLGFRQMLPVQQPDVVHLNWQMEMVQALQAMPVDLSCQPHPGGLFTGRPHPLASLSKTISGNFDAQLKDADVFVFDYPSTTAMWEAACTDARIVFLDIGAGKMTPPIARLFRDRAEIISVAHDDCNRPVLDKTALREAVLGPGRSIDPMPLRRLLAGAA